MTNPTNRDWRTAGYVLTQDSFREAHPELVSRAWIDGDCICWPDRLTQRVNRLRLGVPLCTGCDQPLVNNICADCDLVEVEWLNNGGLAA